MDRIRGTRLAAALTAGALVSALAPWAQGASAATCIEQLDVNGDGRADTVVGTPGEDLSGVKDAGAVTVLMGGASAGSVTATGARQITQEQIGQKSEKGDAMGSSFAVLQWNAGTDFCADLAIGIPGEDGGKGVVVVILGSNSGLDLTKRIVLRQGANGAADTAEAGDRFGETMASGGQSVMGTAASLVVGAPGEDIGAAANAGMALAFRFDISGPSPVLSKAGAAVRQGAGGIPDTPESGDAFASAISFGGGGFSQVLAIGAPGEDLGGKSDVGVVHELDAGDQSSIAFIHQDVARVADTNEAGDRFGSAISWTGSCQGAMLYPALVVGVPGEDVGGKANAGAVIVHEVEDGTDAETIIVQGSGAVADSPEAGDGFGSTLVATPMQVVVGAPGEDLAGKNDAGMITLVTFQCVGPAFQGDIRVKTARHVNQNTTGVPDAVETGDRLGATLGTTTWYTDETGVGTTLVVGSPSEGVGGAAGAGSVTTFLAATTIAVGTGAVFTQNRTGVPDVAEAGDGFGGGLLGRAG